MSQSNPDTAQAAASILEAIAQLHLASSGLAAGRPEVLLLTQPQYEALVRHVVPVLPTTTVPPAGYGPLCMPFVIASSHQELLRLKARLICQGRRIAILEEQPNGPG